MAARKGAGQKRAPSAGTRARTDPGPVTSKADITEHVSQGAGPTRVGSNTPVSSARTAQAAIRDRSAAATGTTLFQKAAQSQQQHAEAERKRWVKT